ncbi:MAG: FadR/GntR family transcriptional regulator [Propionicimonas sp.]|nr:FadR/GntR family transcriptional regulator [Propionicimonas sp.]
MPKRASVARPSSLHAYVVDQLGTAIVAGELKPGDSVAAEELCDRYGVSRTVVREGLRALEFVGMVSARPQVGTTIRPFSDWDLFNPDVIRWRNRTEYALTQTRELLQVRLGIEPQAARLAAVCMDTTQREHLERLSKQLDAALVTGDQDANVSADIDFHLAILAGSGNSVFRRFGSMVEAMLRTRQAQDRSDTAQALDSSVALHRQLGTAIVTGDPDMAEALSRTIVQATLAELEPEDSSTTAPAPGSA